MSNRKKMLLVYIHQKHGTERTWYDDDDNPHDSMEWKHTFYCKKIGRTQLKKTLERYNDGDYDFTSRVMYVTKLDGTVLLDFEYFPYVHVADYMEEGEKKERYFSRLKSERENIDRRHNETIERIMKYPDLVWKDGDDKNGDGIRG